MACYFFPQNVSDGAVTIAGSGLQSISSIKHVFEKTTLPKFFLITSSQDKLIKLKYLNSYWNNISYVVGLPLNEVGLTFKQIILMCT